VTSLVDKLERNGHVRRQRDTEDRRRIWIEITAVGRKALAASPDFLQDRFQAAFGKLDAWEQAMIIAALERVSAMLDAATLDASPVLDIGDLDRLLNG
jgi:DNA-binding MarR family transcriptional regulator